MYLVDDDEAMRHSITWLLKSHGYRVSCHENADRLLQALDTHQSMNACAIFDIHMPGMSGIKLQDKLREMGYRFPIAFITGHGEIADAVHAFQQGAIDFIQKPFKDNILCDLVEKMLAKAYLNQEQNQEYRQMQSKFQSLTPREKEVLDLILAGKSNLEMSDDLGITVKTVEVHRAHIIGKVDLHTPTRLIKAALKYYAVEEG